MNDEQDFVNPYLMEHEDANYPQAASTNLWAALLSPRTLQILMLSGGGLLVLGLVIWLWAQGVFENALITAVTLGLTNLGVLALGMVGVRHSRYQTAGMALTILACLVLPLNLWFYDAQGLVTLAEGGHLWVAALVCCSLYVAVAGILANPVFAYPIVGGVALTGLLFLADKQVGRFWEITAPSALLMVIGMIAIHAERLFSHDAGPFSRDKFGRAFFRAGHIVLAVGMVVLISGHVVGWVYEPFFAGRNWFPQPAVATHNNLKIIALGLSLAAAYSYFYSQIVVAQRGRYTASAVATLLWCALILMDLLAIPFTMEVAAMMAASSALIARLPNLWRRGEALAVVSGDGPFARLTADRTLEGFSRAASAIALLLVGCSYARARFATNPLIHAYQLSEMFVVTASLTAVTIWLGSRSLARGGREWHLVAVAILAVFVVAGTIESLGYAFGPHTLVGEMLVPVVIAAYALSTQDVLRRREWSTAAEAAAAILLAVGCGVAFGMVDVVSLGARSIWLAVFFAGAAICHGLISSIRFRIHSAVGVALSVCCFAWQLMLAMDITQHVFLYATLLTGVTAVGGAKITPAISPLRTICQWTGRICLSYGGVAAMLLAAARLLTGESYWAIVGLLAAYCAASGATAWLAVDSKWRRHFTIVATFELGLMLLTIGSLSTLSFAQRVELLATAAGAFILVAGVMGWLREQDRRDPLVSCNLAVGSLLAAVPLVIGLICHRLDLGWDGWGWVMLHELGALLIGLVLLGVGVLCRIRWSTITGAGALAVYVLSLVLLVRLPDQLQTTAIYMMVGGGAFFTTAVLLSIYRDRLLALPQKLKDGEGVFQVLTWR